MKVVAVLRDAVARVSLGIDAKRAISDSASACGVPRTLQGIAKSLWRESCADDGDVAALERAILLAKERGEP